MGRENKPKGYWTVENVFREAKRYTSKAEFRKNSRSAYAIAYKNGWIGKMDWLMPSCKPNGYWTKEKVFEESKKYTTKLEFRKGNYSAYSIAEKKKWISEMDWLISSRKPNGYWTKEKVFEESRKYTTKKDFKEKSYLAYLAAVRNNWIKEITWLKARITKESGYWKNKDNVFEESKKYTTRSDFSRGCDSAYKMALKNNWLDEMTWLRNLKDLDKDKVDCVYVYKFEKQKTIYVGRTIDRKQRNLDHHLDQGDSVKKFVESRDDVQWVEMEIIEDNLTLREGQEKETYWVGYYRNEGWTLLNKAKPGGLGPIGAGKWNYESCKIEAKKYSSRKQFQIHNQSAYVVSKKKGWLNEFFLEKIKEARKVDQLDLNGNFIKTFNTISEAERSVKISSGITNCCKGRQKTAGGFKWRYHKEEDNKEE